jgi:hypothetical protein
MADKPLIAEQLDAEDFFHAVELYYERGWTDGLPVLPPTEKRVRALLDAAGLDPGHVLGEIPERDRILTAEHLAINAAMAGCLPAYMPVLVAAVEAITDPAYKFNHMASLGSPWPMFVVNGPLSRELEFNSGLYLFGPTTRANATCARAMSLLLWNCAEARPDGIQRGQWGNPFRAVGFVAEDESTAWEPLHVTLGFPAQASTVTAVSLYPGLHQLHCPRSTPEGLLDTVVDDLSTSEFFRGTYTLFVSPQHAAVFHEHGWTKRHVRDYLWERCKRSVADLKRRGTWGVMADKPDAFSDFTRDVLPGDEQRFVYLFKPTEYDRFMQAPGALERGADVYVVVGGGNAGIRIAYVVPYGVSADPVTKAVRAPASAASKESQR